MLPPSHMLRESQSKYFQMGMIFFTIILFLLQEYLKTLNHSYKRTSVSGKS